MRWESSFVEWLRDVELVDGYDKPVDLAVKNRERIFDLIEKGVALGIGVTMNDPACLATIDKHFETSSLMNKNKHALVSTIQNQAFYMHMVLVPMMRNLLCNVSGEKELQELIKMKERVSHLEEENKGLYQEAMLAP